MQKNKIAQFSSIEYRAISRWKFHEIADGTIGDTGLGASAAEAGRPFKFKFSSFCSSERRNWTLTFIGRPLHYHSPYLTRNHRNKYHAREFSRNFHFPNYIFEYGKKKITNRENFCYVLKFFFSNFLTIYQKKRIFSIENREGEGKKGKEREREKERGGEERGRERERKRER